VLRQLLNDSPFGAAWHAVASGSGLPGDKRPTRDSWLSWAKKGGRLPQWLGGEPTLPDFSQSWDSERNLAFLAGSGLYYYFKLTVGRRAVERLRGFLEPARGPARLLANGLPDVRPPGPLPLEPPVEVPDLVLPGRYPFEPVPDLPVIPFFGGGAPQPPAPVPWMEPLLEPLLPRPAVGGVVLPEAAAPWWAELLPALELA
jgi:hypothetical protein